MAQQYVVVHAFQDKYTKQYYGVGSIYDATDENRAMDLENGGYIVPDNTEAANAAKAMAKGEQAAKANAQELQQAYQQIKKDVEPKTVVNGKVVPLKAAQAAEAAFSVKNTQTGVQAHHDNSTEAVPAGGLAQQKVQSQSQQQAQYQANAQSGQQALEKELQAAPSSSPNEAANAEAYNSQAMQGDSMGAYTSQQYQQEQQQAQGQSQQQSQQQRNQAAEAAAARAEKTNAADADHFLAAEEGKAARAASKTNAKSKGNQ